MQKSLSRSLQPPSWVDRAEAVGSPSPRPPWPDASSSVARGGEEPDTQTARYAAQTTASLPNCRLMKGSRGACVALSAARLPTSKTSASRSMPAFGSPSGNILQFHTHRAFWTDLPRVPAYPWTPGYTDRRDTFLHYVIIVHSVMRLLPEGAHLLSLLVASSSEDRYASCLVHLREALAVVTEALVRVERSTY